MATNRKFIGEQTPGARGVPDKRLAGNPKFIGENTVGSINRINPDRAFLSNKVRAGLVPVDMPNGVVSFEDGGPGQDFQQGRGGQQVLGNNTRYGMGGVGLPRQLFGGNRSGE